MQQTTWTAGNEWTLFIFSVDITLRPDGSAIQHHWLHDVRSGGGRRRFSRRCHPEVEKVQLFNTYIV